MRDTSSPLPCFVFVIALRKTGHYSVLFLCLPRERHFQANILFFCVFASRETLPPIYWCVHSPEVVSQRATRSFVVSPFVIAAPVSCFYWGLVFIITDYIFVFIITDYIPTPNEFFGVVFVLTQRGRVPYLTFIVSVQVSKKARASCSVGCGGATYSLPL